VEILARHGRFPRKPHIQPLVQLRQATASEQIQTVEGTVDRFDALCEDAFLRHPQSEGDPPPPRRDCCLRLEMAAPSHDAGFVLREVCGVAMQHVLHPAPERCQDLPFEADVGHTAVCRLEEGWAGSPLF
jgi:hypothetical protein